MKSIWNGSIGFGLVNIPVRLYLAIREKEVPLHSLCKNGHRIVYKRWCPVEEREVSWQELKKGFEISKDKFVVLEKEDIEKIKIPSTKTIEIKEFVDAQIDPIYIEKSYYLVPDKNGERAYSLFFQTLALTNKVGIGKFTLKEKEHVVAIRAYKKGLLLQTLHYEEEIIDMDTLAELDKLPKPEKKEIELAQMLVNKLSREEFDISKFKDEYTEALKELIQAKVSGKSFEIKAEKEAKKAKSLIESLTESLKQK
ncbi:MAG: Ku protein [Candidatus Micrarchaeia archaeon]|jgi:DNA end-binding protein Ku